MNLEGIIKNIIEENIGKNVLFEFEKQGKFNFRYVNHINLI